MTRSKRIHWTQTPAGKAKLAERAKLKDVPWRRAMKETERMIADIEEQNPSHGVTDATEQTHVAYIYGKIETIIEYYARSNGVPFAALASGVASLLSHSQSR